MNKVSMSSSPRADAVIGGIVGLSRRTAEEYTQPLMVDGVQTVHLNGNNKEVKRKIKTVPQR